MVSPTPNPPENLTQQQSLGFRFPRAPATAAAATPKRCLCRTGTTEKMDSCVIVGIWTMRERLSFRIRMELLNHIPKS